MGIGVKLLGLIWKFRLGGNFSWGLEMRLDGFHESGGDWEMT